MGFLVSSSWSLTSVLLFIYLAFLHHQGVLNKKSQTQRQNENEQQPDILLRFFFLTWGQTTSDSGDSACGVCGGGEKTKRK